VVIADYGASQGVNSLRPVSLASDAIRDGTPDREILVVHTDLPSNDFGTLLTTVDSDPCSYLWVPETAHTRLDLVLHRWRCRA
jgi:salicylate 1-O-methyltransferase